MTCIIHETAIVHPDAKLGERINVGAYSIIEKDVEIGDDTRIGPHVVIRNHSSIGQHSQIYQFCSIGEDPQHQGYSGEPTRLEIGDCNVIREHCTLNRGTAEHTGVTRIGNNNMIMAYVHIAHDCRVGDHTIFANGASLAGHVEVGDYAIMGGFTLVHQFCKVGAHCITGIGTVCFKDVPPFIIASGYAAKPYGLNMKGLRRRNFSETSIGKLKKAYRLLYQSNLGLKMALTEIENLDPQAGEIKMLCGFLRNSDRGIIRA